VKYQDMLKLARDEITNINKQHEIEINNLIDKLNLTRDTNIEKLRQELQLSSGNGQAYLNKAQVVN
jgi:polyhydroxyalkanoate synthesis regulator phasin